MSRVLAVAALLVLPGIAEAQTWRAAELARQVRDSAAHRVRVDYGAGRFVLSAGEGPLLYEARIRYDETQGTPHASYEAADRELELGVRIMEDESRGERHRGEMRLALSPHVPFDLELDLGAVQSDIDLGGLAIRELSIEASASRASVTFEQPNRTAMQRLDLHARAASLVARRLANANAAEMRFGAGFGSVELDFGGRWTRDIEASIDVALGQVKIRVPEAVGVRVEISRVLAGFEHHGLEKRGDAFVSSNWDDAEHHLTLRIDTAFGTVSIERGGD